MGIPIPHTSLSMVSIRKPSSIHHTSHSQHRGHTHRNSVTNTQLKISLWNCMTWWMGSHGADYATHFRLPGRRGRVRHSLLSHIEICELVITITPWKEDVSQTFNKCMSSMTNSKQCMHVSVEIGPFWGSLPGILPYDSAHVMCSYCVALEWCAASWSDGWLIIESQIDYWSACVAVRDFVRDYHSIQLCTNWIGLYNFLVM